MKRYDPEIISYEIGDFPEMRAADDGDYVLYTDALAEIERRESAQEGERADIGVVKGGLPMTREEIEKKVDGVKTWGICTVAGEPVFRQIVTDDYLFLISAIRDLLKPRACDGCKHFNPPACSMIVGPNRQCEFRPAKDFGCSLHEPKG